MSFTHIGDLAGSFRLRLMNAQLKSDANRLGGELASGRKADVALSTGGDLTSLAEHQRGVTMLTEYGRNIAEFSLRADATQIALGSIGAMADVTGPALLDAGEGGSLAAIPRMAREAEGMFTAAVDALNTRVAGVSIFAGAASDGAALQSADTILAALEAHLAGATTADEAADLTDAFFTDPAGYFATTAYLGSDNPSGPIRISDRESAALAMTALDPGLRQMLAAAATAAMADRNIAGLGEAENAALLGKAGQKMLDASGDLTESRATLGAIEARAAAVAARHAGEKASLGIAINNLTAADPYETAAAFQAVESQVEALYLATARLSQLSLARFLS